ncbi:amidohydrolase family protein [Thalassospira marina]|uniref:Amidohydrolase-related domain-containing protein n=1 Tax=Thalassospira marina TaxID=2048283 RepID=A0ABM6QBA3_9PROT|nr:amidohydrolase family protein [Thalassospira marina]AUG53820.1 hypothetical protein CSC3H3_14695 [Thalassospira marina]
MTQTYQAMAFTVPENACDCHVHVFDAGRFPLSADRVYTPDHAPLSALEAHLAQLSFRRAILVQASPYGTDNACILDAIEGMGQDRARAVAVIDDSFGDEDLARLHGAGVRGIRLNLRTHGDVDAQSVAAQLDHAVQRVLALGWHIQIYTTLGNIALLEDKLAALPVDLVLDHMCCLDAAGDLTQTGFDSLCRLLACGHVYLKLSALYRVSRQPGYGEVQPFIEKLFTTRPDRMLWGSDWPHTMPAPGTVRSPDKIEHFRPEDNGQALNLVAQWAGDPAIVKAMLVDNPERLYWR